MADPPPGADTGARLAALYHAHGALDPGARVAAARRDCATLALSLDADAASSLQAALFALSELDTGARAPGGHAPAAHGSGSTLGAPVDLARGSPHAQWLGGPDREGDPGAIGRFLFLYAVRARLPERLDDVRRLGPRAAAARWAEEDEASERGRGDHADCIPTEALGRERARRLDRACERAQRAFAATREGLGPPAWPPMPWLALALASNAEAWDRLAGQPPTFWADLRLAGLPHDALATVLHRASQLQRHAGVTCVPPPARLALAEARVRLLAAMEVGVWLLLVGEPAPRSDPDPPPGTRPGSARDAVDPAPTHLETAYVDGPLPPVAPPPDVARMDGPPPPVAGPPGVAPTQRAPGARPPPWRSAARANTRSVASAGWRVFGRVGSGLRRLRPVRARIESPPLGRV